MKITPENATLLFGGATLLMLGAVAYSTMKISKTTEVIMMDLVQIGNMLDEHMLESKKQYESFVGIGE